MTANKFIFKKSFFIFFIFLFLISFALVITKASQAPITHDESLSILLWGSTEVRQVWQMISPHGVPADANNHITNSILLKYSERVFGFNEFSHRLPNVLSFIIFFASTAIAVQLLTRNQFLTLLALPLAILQIGFLDFFSLARGYGISFALLAASLYYNLKFIQSNNGRDLFLIQVFSILCTLSNLATLNFYLSQTFLLGIVIWIRNNQKINHFAILLATFVAGSLLLTPPIIKLLKASAFYFGKNENILKSVYLSLAEELSGRGWIFFQSILLTLLFTAIVVQIIRIKKINISKIEITASNFLFLLLLAITVTMMIQRALFSTPFVTGRAALYLWPIIYLLMIATLFESSLKKIKIVFILLILNLFFVFYFLINWQPIKTNEWAYDINSPSVYQIIKSTCSTNSEVTVGVNWIFVPSINYQIIEDSFICKNLAVRYEAISRPNYLFLRAEDLQSIENLKNDYTRVEIFLDGSSLWRLERLR